jgi:mannuronan 5-epimerase
MGVSIPILLLLLLFLVLMSSSNLLVQLQNVYSSTLCISYDSRDNTIVISCGNASLTDVYKAINANNPGIVKNGPDPKVWLLNANIKVENNSNFYINSTDTSWLKINSTFTGVADKEPNHILARGNLIIDNVKITSWDTNKDDYARANGTIPRSYILVNYGNGTTNITNSELAYLGYPHARSFGLTYYTGAGSIIKNNKIHDLQTGFYSDDFEHGAHNITIAGNEFYNNTSQGIGPRSGSHHLTISNNTVHDNGREGILCSNSCYKIIITGNKVFNNTFYGILLNDNVTNSVVRNNIIHDNGDEQIWLNNLANNNTIDANNINGGINGIRISNGSANNRVNSNTITNSYLASILLLKGASQNMIASNTVNNSNIAVLILDKDTGSNIFKDNNLVNSKEQAIKLYKADNTTNKFENNSSYEEPIMREPNIKGN